MRIDGLDTFVVEQWCIVKIYTDTGIVGIGQGTYFPAPGATERIIQQFRPFLLGQTAMGIERHWQYMYHTSSHWGDVKSSAIAAIDIALWDILGKHFDVPIHILLGGPYRNKVRLYLNVGRGSPDILALGASNAVAAGYSAIKVDPIPDNALDLSTAQLTREVVERVCAVRDAVGPNIDIAVDMHNRLTSAQIAVIGQSLAGLGLFFCEDPIAPGNMRAQADVSRSLSVPVALGERLTTIFEYQDLLQAHAADIIRPDMGLAGGITQFRKIAALAEAYHVGIAPHHNVDPIATAATLQVNACIPNFVIQSYLDDHESEHSRLIKEKFIPDEGYLGIPDGPGLGIELNEEYVRDNRGTDLLTPNTEPWVSHDGSLGFN